MKPLSNIISKKKKQIAVGDKVIFNSGNFEGLTGEVLVVDWYSTHPDAIYGFRHKVKLSNGKIGYIEKSEHWNFLNTIQTC